MYASPEEEQEKEQRQKSAKVMSIGKGLYLLLPHSSFFLLSIPDMLFTQELFIPEHDATPTSSNTSSLLLAQSTLRPTGMARNRTAKVREIYTSSEADEDTSGNDTGERPWREM